ncbi:MAG: adenine deaminase [Candidatus Kapaibacterium sp.]
MASFSISGNIVDIHNREIFPGTIEIENGMIARINREEDKKYDTHIAPGLIDAHVHIESSMMAPSEFARLAVAHGTVATLSDPHEIANVLGMDGIDFMVANGRQVPFKFYFGAPSCVPATPFESSGAKIKPENIRELFKKNKAHYLSEVMNFPGVIHSDPAVMNKIAIAREMNRPIDGHAPGLRGEELRKYVESGITTDHESFSIEEAREKISLGMKILIREGSAAKNFAALHPLLGESPDMCMLCSDDKHPNDLVRGHINELIKRGIAEGYDPITMLRAASLVPVMHYGIPVGLLRPGDHADFIVFDNFEEFNIRYTYINGKTVAADGESFINKISYEKINYFEADEKETDDYRIEAKSDSIRVIEAIDGELITNSTTTEAKIVEGNAVADPERDILKIAVVNRYDNEPPAIAFVRGFGLKRGAIATSVAHDSHNVIGVGASDKDLMQAINAVIRSKGGMAVSDKMRLDVLPLPVAGLMSSEGGYHTAAKYTAIDTSAKQLGTPLEAPFMTLSFMALLVIPELKLSDKGLFDGTTFKFTELFV